MRLAVKLVASVVLLGIYALAPARAMTIQPGVYKLEWKIPGADEDISLAGREATSLRPMSEAETAKLAGAVSSKCYKGSFRGYGLVLDESKGTGTGYDTAYLIPGGFTGSDFDLGAAVKAPLEDSFGMLQSVRDKLVTIDCTVGEPGATVTNKAVVELQIYRAKSGTGDGMPSTAMIAMRGGWYGAVKTDAGDLKVHTIDMNSNTVYGDVMTVGENIYGLRPGDLVMLGNPPNSLEDYSGLLLSEICSYGGKLYTVTVSKTGDSVEFQPYTGETGKLKIDARDGRKQPVRCSAAVLFGKPGYFVLTECSEITLPPGQYRCGAAILMPEQTGPKENRFSLTLAPDRTVTVKRGDSATLTVGGPLRMEISPDRSLAAERGGSCSVDIALTAGADKVTGFGGGRSVTVGIRDSRGKLLQSGKAEFG